MAEPRKTTCPVGQPDEQKIVKIHTRMRRSRRAKVMWARTILFISILSIVSGLFLLNSEIFRIRSVRIQGANRVPVREVERLAGIKSGANILTMGAHSIRESLLQNPLIKDAEVKRVLPDKVIVIVHERAPFAYVMIGRKFYMVDSEQIVIEIARAPADKGLKIITSDGARPADVGGVIEFPRKELVETFFKYAESMIAGQYKSVRFNKDGITVILKNGAYVQLGEGEELGEKMKYVPLLVQSLDRSGQQYAGINLKNMQVPTFVRKGSDPETVTAAEGGQ